MKKYLRFVNPVIVFIVSAFCVWAAGVAHMNLPNVVLLRAVGYIIMFVVGSYFFVCATWFRNFPPYEALVKRVMRFFGKDAEKAAHIMYQIFGIGILVCLALLLLGVLKPVI